MHKRIALSLLLLCVSSALLLADQPFSTTQENMNAPTQAIANANNSFALDHYAQLRGKDGNLFFSPYSIDSALLMVRAGSVGQTAAEINHTLKLPADKSDTELDAAMANLSAGFNSQSTDRGYELSVANAMWGQVGQAFLPAFTSRLQTDYGAQANSVDYGQPAAAAQTINDWVESQTHNRITHLIDASMLGPLTKLVLTNAIYFKGTWSSVFSAKATRPMTWNDGIAAATQSGADVPMMYQSSPVDYVKQDDFAAVQLPYVGNDLAMLVILPDDPAGLPGLEKKLDANLISGIVGGLHRAHRLQLYLPKFKLDASYELSGTLAAMGMPTAFSHDADFSGMDGKRDLYISGVIHKSFVQVDETGTEAAAATGVTMRTMAMPARAVEFKADHPFLFLIRDVHSGTILFLGRITRPQQ
jgi:serpin B